MQNAILHGTFPHQTGVTQRSISYNDWCSAHFVVEYVVVAHLDDGISASVVTESNGHHHLAWVEFGILGGDKAGCLNRMKHPLKVVQAGHNSGAGSEEHPQSQ